MMIRTRCSVPESGYGKVLVSVSCELDSVNLIVEHESNLRIFGFNLVPTELQLDFEDCTLRISGLGPGNVFGLLSNLPAPSRVRPRSCGWTDIQTVDPEHSTAKLQIEFQEIEPGTRQTVPVETKPLFGGHCLALNWSKYSMRNFLRTATIL
jgi:hypothetical protein